MLIRSSLDEPLRLCSEQSRTYYLHSCLWSFGHRPCMAMLVSRIHVLSFTTEVLIINFQLLQMLQNYRAPPTLCNPVHRRLCHERIWGLQLLVQHPESSCLHSQSGFHICISVSEIQNGVVLTMLITTFMSGLVHYLNLPTIMSSVAYSTTSLIYHPFPQGKCLECLVVSWPLSKL